MSQTCWRLILLAANLIKSILNPTHVSVPLEDNNRLKDILGIFPAFTQVENFAYVSRIAWVKN